MGHLEPLEIDIRDLLAEAEEHYSRRVIVGPLVLHWNNLERQSIWGYDITGVLGEKMFTTSSTVQIEIFYKTLDDASEWRHYDGSYYEAFIVEGTFYLYSGSDTKGAIYAEKLRKVSVNDYKKNYQP